jgi:hypothetical protein
MLSGCRGHVVVVVVQCRQILAHTEQLGITRYAAAYVPSSGAAKGVRNIRHTLQTLQASTDCVVCAHVHAFLVYRSATVA